jgi:hypothetical protein
MAPPPTPPTDLPTVTFRVCVPQPCDDASPPPSGQRPASRRPQGDLPPEADLQKWLDLSG